jgi:hypothetical protein
MAKLSPTIFSPVFFESRMSVIVRFLRSAGLGASAIRANYTSPAGI